MKRKNQDGFVALMSSIVISILLMAIIFSVALTDFFSRFNILDTESKEKSLNLAESCADIANLDLLSDPDTSINNRTESVGDQECTIFSAQSSGSQYVITTQGVVNKSYTNLRITRNSATNALATWKECENLASC
jgi:hypothetical protein